MPELTPLTDEALQAASVSGRAAIETALERYTPEQRDQFWNAIGLYYSTRRHPGAGEAPSVPPTVAAA